MSCLLTQQMSCLQTQQMSRLQTQQITCLQTQQGCVFATVGRERQAHQLAPNISLLNISAPDRDARCSQQETSPLSTEGVSAVHRASLLATGSISGCHTAMCALWMLHMCNLNSPQRLQKPLNAELDVYAVKSQNEHQFPERGALIYRKEGLGAQGATKKGERKKARWAM